MPDGIGRIAIVIEEVVPVEDLTGEVRMIAPHPGVKHGNHGGTIARGDRPGIGEGYHVLPLLIRQQGIVREVVVGEPDIRLNVRDIRLCQELRYGVRCPGRAVELQQERRILVIVD